MRGGTRSRCFCRDPETGKLLGAACPKRKRKGHLKWYIRYDAPPIAGRRRRQPEEGPFESKAAAEEALTRVLADADGGARRADQSLTVGQYLAFYEAGLLRQKPRTLESTREAIRLYWGPALGHIRLRKLTDSHVAQAVRAMMQVNVPDPEPSEMLTRMLAARAEDARRVLPPGERRHRRSSRPLSPARIQRMFAVLRAAMNKAVKTGKISVSPCLGAEIPVVPRVRPLPWTDGRVRAFRAQLDRDLAAAGELSPEARQRMWAQPSRRPCPVMVWLPAQTGAFLDAAEGERLYALFALAAFCGLRRGELTGLEWPDVDLEAGFAHVRGATTKTDAGARTVPLPEVVTAALRAWKKQQARERLAAGPGWARTRRVFTREDGGDVPGQWARIRFETLAFRAGLPPVRFHDLRHGAASLCKAAGLDTKIISAVLGHARSSFTADVYVHLFPEVMTAAMDTAAAVVPRAGREAQ